MNINLNDLKNMLELAFDQGWSGYKEAKNDYVNKIIEDYIKKMPQVYQNDFGVVTTTTTAESLKNTSSYYSYTCTSGIENPTNITDTF